MKSLIRGAEPRELLAWKSDNRLTPENLKYGRAGFPSEALRCALLQQQHYLCAYTLIRLKKPQECSADYQTRESCHIEHILPQTRGELVEKKRSGEEVKEVVNFTPVKTLIFTIWWHAIPQASIKHIVILVHSIKTITILMIIPCFSHR